MAAKKSAPVVVSAVEAQTPEIVAAEAVPLHPWLVLRDAAKEAKAVIAQYETVLEDVHIYLTKKASTVDESVIEESKAKILQHITDLGYPEAIEELYVSLMALDDYQYKTVEEMDIPAEILADSNFNPENVVANNSLVHEDILEYIFKRDPNKRAFNDELRNGLRGVFQPVKIAKVKANKPATDGNKEKKDTGSKVFNHPKYGDVKLTPNPGNGGLMHFKGRYPQRIQDYIDAGKTTKDAMQAWAAKQH